MKLKNCLLGIGVAGLLTFTVSCSAGLVEDHAGEGLSTANKVTLGAAAVSSGSGWALSITEAIEKRKNRKESEAQDDFNRSL